MPYIDDPRDQERPFRFEQTFCSQCGANFGPGNSGFSHCSDHRRRRWVPDAPPAPVANGHGRDRQKAQATPARSA